MNKKALLFYGVSACALAMVASVIASPSLAPSILNTNRIAQAEHTFEVPSTSTSFTEKTEKLSAYATSPSGYQFELEFTGFEKEGDDLTLQAGVWSTVTNVLPLDLGFDTFQVAFSSAVKEYHNYWSAVFFSYHQMTLEGIQNGSYGDMYTVIDYNNFYQNFDISVDDQGDLNATLPSYRYMFAILVVDYQVKFEGMRFSSQCSNPASDPGDGAYTDFKPTEKTQMSTWLGGEPLPFVGNGAYNWINEQQWLKGYMFSGANMTNYFSTLESEGYAMTYQEMYSDTMMCLYQKKAVVNEEEVVRSVMMSIYNAYDLFPYEIRLTTAYGYLGSSTEWPVEEFEASLSPSFASFLAQYPFAPKERGFTYKTVKMEQPSGEVQLQILVENIDFADDAAAISYIEDYLDDIVSENSTTYHVFDKTKGSDYFTYSVIENNQLHGISTSYSHDYGLSFVLVDRPTFDSFPESLINSLLQGKTCVPYEETGTFAIMNSYFPVGVNVYGASMADANEYRDLLVALGYTLENRENEYHLNKGLFGDLQISIDYSNFATYGFFTIFYEENNSGGSRYDDLNNALYDICGKEDLITNHVYPELVSSDIYIVMSSSDEHYKRGIYINEGVSYYNALISGEHVTYVPFYDAYLFLDEVDPNDSNRCFALQAEQIEGGVRFYPMVVNKIVDGLKNALEATEYVQSQLENHFLELQTIDPDKYTRAMSDVINFTTLLANPDNYQFRSGYYGENAVDIYGSNPESIKAELINNINANMSQYTYSNFQQGFVDEETGVMIQFHYYSDYETQVKHLVVEFYFDRTLKDFNKSATYFGTLQTMFADLTPEARYIELNNEGKLGRIVADDKFDRVTFINDLSTAGFVGEDMSFFKVEDNKLYRVTMRNSYSDYDSYFDEDSGFTYLEFEYEENYCSTYANIISSLAGAIDPNLINALPASVTDDSASFHSQIESFGHLKLTVLDAYGKSSFISQLETMGFVSLDSYHLSLKDENYEINVSINDYSGFGCEVNFFCTSFNWTTKPNYYECLDNEMFFWAHEYMPLPDETGNICIIESNNDNELILKFKSSIDMDTYKTKLESFGYEINNKYDDGCDYIYHGSDCDIDCFVDESGDTPRVCFRLLSYDAHPYKGEYLAAVCNNRGFSGITLPEGFVIEANLMEFYENENNKGFNFEKVDNIDQIVSTLQSAGYTETVYEGETVYTKTIGGFTYSVHVYTKDSNVSIEIQSVSE